MLSGPSRFLGTPKRSSIFPSGCDKAQVGFFKCGPEFLGMAWRDGFKSEDFFDHFRLVELNCM